MVGCSEKAQGGDGTSPDMMRRMAAHRGGSSTVGWKRPYLVAVFDGGKRFSVGGGERR
jgi:hypothetical protein